MNCLACKNKIERGDALHCTKCKECYHYKCINMTSAFYREKYHELSKRWTCPKCENSVRGRRNDDTPASPADFRPVNEQTGQIQICELVAELRLLREEMSAVRVEIKEFSCTVAHLTDAINNCDRKVDNLTVRVEALEKSQHDNPHVSFERTVADLKAELNDRDQEMLSNDIEIAGIPEEMAERSVHLVLSVAQKLGVALQEHDLVSAERVGAVRRAEPGAAEPRPRPIVVRLARRVHRDKLLAAARVRRGVDTSNLALNSSPRPFHVNERLTRYNRQLFYKARQELPQKNYKFIWTRDGKIFCRKEHGAPRLRLRTEEDLSRVFGMQ